jgi:hypothetical protein
MSARIAYLTDVEGQWPKLSSFAADNPAVSLDRSELRVADGARFVFGGDALDRGPSGRRILATLLAAKRRQPEQVVLLSGNRDLNKMRLARELGGYPPADAPLRARGADLLRWIFERTMGARHAFEHRRAELAQAGLASGDDAVCKSFAEDAAPGGVLGEYLASCQLAFRSRETLFVHGGVTAANLGRVPGAAAVVADVDQWVAELNAFHARQVDAFARSAGLDGLEAGYAELVAYQAPLPGSKLNQASVVYARPADADNNPLLPEAEVIRTLREAGVRRVVVGHTPSGDCPSVLRDGRGFELVLADNSYGRIERGSKVFVSGTELRVVGEAILDDGDRVAVRFTIDLDDVETPIGRRDPTTGRLIKAQLARGDYLMFRGRARYRVEQIAATLDQLPSAPRATP